MSVSAYESYRETALRWADTIPTLWSEARLRWLAKRYAGGTPDKNKGEYWEGGTIPWLNSGAVNQDLIDEPSAFITEAALASSSARWLPAGALVMALAGQGKTKGMVAQVNFETTCNQSMAAIVPNERIIPRYLLWWLRANYQNIRNMSGGDLRDGLNLELLGDIGCPLPTLDEQVMIASFLDRETAKIDDLAEEQGRLIDLLKEKRQAVISHVVTKGLDPSVPMKDSSVEWLGEMPEHWEAGRIKRFWSVTDCKHLTADFVEDGVPLASIREVQARFVDLSRAKQTTDAFFWQMVEGGRQPEAGDLIFSRNATVGEVAEVADWHPRFAMGQDVCLLRRQNPRSSTAYLYHTLRSEIVSEQLAVAMIGSTFKRVNVEEIRSLKIPVPPPEEQRAIAGYVEALATSFDALAAEAGAAIALLQERRRALISAAVTGKIDVRGLVSSEAEAA